jgi:hypothetical protein
LDGIRATAEDSADACARQDVRELAIGVVVGERVIVSIGVKVLPTEEAERVRRDKLAGQHWVAIAGTVVIEAGLLVEPLTGKGDRAGVARLDGDFELGNVEVTVPVFPADEEEAAFEVTEGYFVWGGDGPGRRAGRQSYQAAPKSAALYDRGQVVAARRLGGVGPLVIENVNIEVGWKEGGPDGEFVENGLAINFEGHEARAVALDPVASFEAVVVLIYGCRRVVAGNRSEG